MRASERERERGENFWFMVHGSFRMEHRKTLPGFRLVYPYYLSLSLSLSHTHTFFRPLSFSCTNSHSLYGPFWLNALKCAGRVRNNIFSEFSHEVVVFYILKQKKITTDKRPSFLSTFAAWYWWNLWIRLPSPFLSQRFFFSAKKIASFFFRWSQNLWFFRGRLIDATTSVRRSFSQFLPRRSLTWPLPFDVKMVSACLANWWRTNVFCFVLHLMNLMDLL